MSKSPAHPGGHCTCTGKHRKIVRVYLGYGLCRCGKLTPHKWRGWRKREPTQKAPGG